uniref:CDP-diacylglycerol--inositol 3-phosphatidyltransferase n=2 Tax=Chrysotila carterae TaxID=13221 RepID=A0A7S4B4E4_CHRCT|mmetsp:Transcript_2900/g.5981  ORF Transcript_2900/g.5981 Transcript_2900/m.5981 type:complete len:236 (+) Transcript_2900:389-1096(+)
MTSILYDTVLSPFYDRLVVIWPANVHPNAITILGGCACSLSIIAMQSGRWGVACIAYTLYHMFDNMDGKHARRTRQTSRFGKLLDHAIDGSVGITAACQICCECLFNYPEAIHFALCCGMGTMLTCHLAEYVSGIATLGTRFFSADELFLICSLALAWRSLAGTSLMHLGDDSYWCVQWSWTGGVAVMALLTVRSWTWLLGLAAFACVCMLASWPWPVVVYAPCFTVLLLSNSFG